MKQIISGEIMKRSRTLAAILAFGLALFGTVASAQFFDGYQLKTWFDARDRVERGNYTSADVQHQAYGLAYVAGVSDVVTGITFCASPNVTVGQLLAVVRKHLLANPEKWDKSGAALVIDALQQAFPCK